MTRKKEILNQIKSIVSSVLQKNSYKLFIFGSQVDRKEWINADIDLGIESNNPIPNDKWSKIWHGIDDLATIYTFDLVDFKKVKDSFKKVALSKVEYI